MSDSRKEILFSDLASVVEPQDIISDNFEKGKWRRVPYETKDIKGTMVSTMSGCHAPALTLSPKLTGWYAIYVGLNPAYGESSLAYLSTTGDIGHSEVTPAPGVSFWSIDEFFWKYEDMTGKDLTIAHPDDKVTEYATHVAFVRFIPLTEEEVEEIKRDRADTSTRRIFASDDVDNMTLHGPRTLDPFISRVENYRYSDVKILSMEKFDYCDYSKGERVTVVSPTADNKADTEAYFKEHGLDCHKAMIDHGHSFGMEMFLSMRMGMWGFDFPLDEAFRCSYFDNHPELRQKDRDGIEIFRLSYAYPETRKYMADLFSDMAKYDCDGIDFLFHRGYPYILFEEPFLKVMKDTYGVDARELSNNDPRIIKEKCRIMTDFIVEVKERLNHERKERGQKPLKIAIHTLKTLEASKFIGIDIEELVDREIVDHVICYPLIHFEHMPDEVFTDAEKTKIDIAKYSQAIIDGEKEFQWGFYDCCQGINGRYYDIKEDNEEDLRALSEVFEGKKAQLYIDIMPRTLSIDKLKERVLKIYKEKNCSISLWDTESRARVRRNWILLSRLGHRDEIEGFEIHDGKWYKNHNLLSILNQRMDRYHPNWGG